MFYKLLGMLVWRGAKLFLRRKYGPTYAPKPLLAGGVLAIALGIALLVVKRNGNGS
jgi:hypothetical protein